MLWQHVHRRLNALTGDWVLVSPHRTQRPWHGKTETLPDTKLLSYDANCYLCPGNERANGQRNPRYVSTFVFDNDFPALLPEPSQIELSLHPLLSAHLAAGVSRVICYSPCHDLTLAEMQAHELRPVIDTWGAQYTELSQSWQWVQIFENKGEVMGCSNPHHHGQIWASDFVPTEVAKELTQQQKWRATRQKPLLLEYATLESRSNERVVIENAYWVAVVPWWAVWPFESLLIPRRHVAQLTDLGEPEKDALADLLSHLLKAYDRLFSVRFPYSFGWHGAPGTRNDISVDECWQLHAHFYPPLLRSATVRKFHVGFEMLAEPQRDITPEVAAERLRAVVA